MTSNTPAGNLVRAFGDADTMATLYAESISWYLPKGAGFTEPYTGRDAVVAFNREVWSVHYRPDCSVEVLDEIGDESLSAVRFIYRAFSLHSQSDYVNEYTLFARSSDEGIVEVFESFDTASTMQQMTAAMAQSGS